MTNRRSSSNLHPMVRLLLLTVMLFAPVLGAWAEPKMEPLSPLENSYQAGKRYTIRMRYTDPDDEPITKTKCLFVDEGPAGRIEFQATAIEGDIKTGATIVWDINKFEQGSHKAFFQVKAGDTTVRYPGEADGFYSFGVEALGTKFALMGGGLLVGLAGIPFIVFVLSRSMNPKGDPASAARVGLLFGILACCALFIFLFANVYGPLVWAILVLGIIAAIILGTRKR